jgi:prevent-host-death family protein
MTTVGCFEAKTHLAELLQRAFHGEQILITRHGKPAAMLVPPPQEERTDVKQVVKEMLAYRAQQKRTLGGLSVRDLMEEGRH